jgi:hypothetical protein
MSESETEKDLLQKTVLSQEDLKMIRNLRDRMQLSYHNAEKAVLENKVAELELKNLLFSIYLKYKLDIKDSIDEITGIVNVNTQG